MLSSPHLILAGVVHHDPSVPDRLWKLLEERRPAGVSLEMSPYSLRFRREHSQRLAELLDQAVAQIGPEAEASGHVRAIRRAIGLPSEYEAASAWARRRGVGLELVDLSRVARGYLEHLEELVSVANLRALIAGGDKDPDAELDRQRRVAMRLVRGAKPLEAKIWPVPVDPDTVEREAHMERRIRRVLEGGRTSSWVHVGGWEHMLWIEGRPSLFARLRNMSPDRVIV